MHRVFVYGSLKQGYCNSSLLRNDRYIADRLTEDDTYVMRSLGSFPGVVRSYNGMQCRPVSGELYEVSSYTLNRLDILESNGHFYNRELIKLREEKDPAWMYLLNSDMLWGRDMTPKQIDNESYYKW
jgi:gamma-glutamylaminecyclotransferase